MKVIFDTNVFISGIFWKGNYCTQIIDKWKNQELILVSSREIIEELVETLRNFKIQMPEELIEEWKTTLRENSVFIEPRVKLEVIKEDPDNNKFLEAGVSANVDLIISQDKHLLRLKEYEGIKIIKPQQALLLIK